MDSIVIRFEWIEILNGLPSEVRLEVYDAIFRYAQSGTLSELKPMARIAFLFVKREIDMANGTRQDLSDKRRAAANARWKGKEDSQYNLPSGTCVDSEDGGPNLSNPVQSCPNLSKRIQTDANGCKRMQTDAKDAIASGEAQKRQQNAANVTLCGAESQEKDEVLGEIPCKNEEVGSANARFSPLPPRTPLTSIDNSQDIDVKSIDIYASNISRDILYAHAREEDESGKSRKEELDISKLMRWFNDNLGGRIPKVMSMNETRKALVMARSKEHGKRAVFDVLEAVKRSAFLTGGNDKGWKCSFDWIFKRANFQKILEGCYADRKPAPTRREGVFYNDSVDEYKNEI